MIQNERSGYYRHQMLLKLVAANFKEVISKLQLAETVFPSNLDAKQIASKRTATVCGPPPASTNTTAVIPNTIPYSHRSSTMIFIF